MKTFVLAASLLLSSPALAADRYVHREFDPAAHAGKQLHERVALVLGIAHSGLEVQRIDAQHFEARSGFVKGTLDQKGNITQLVTLALARNPDGTYPVDGTMKDPGGNVQDVNPYQYTVYNPRRQTP